MISDLKYFEEECRRYLKAVSSSSSSSAPTDQQQQNDTTTTAQHQRLPDSSCHAGLHGRQASWTLEFEDDALGTPQPILVGKYTLVSSRISKNDHKNENEDEDEDEFAAPSRPSRKKDDKEHRVVDRRLQITLFISYNQPYGVPALDFIASDLDNGGQPVTDVNELKENWLGKNNSVDAVELDAEAAKRFAASEKRNDENTNDNNNTNNNTLLIPSPVPRISRMIHEILNIPVFCVHACDTVSYFKLMKVKMMREQRQQQQQCSIDIVLALYGKFIGLS